MIDRRLLEAIDACRPGTDDCDQPEVASAMAVVSSDPQLAAVAQRVHDADVRIRDAMHTEVPEPEGLEQRLIARLQQASAALHSEVEDAFDERQPEQEPPAVVPMRRNKLPWAVGLSGVAAAAVILVVGYLGGWFTTAEAALTRADIEQRIDRWHRQILSDADRWQSDAPPASYPLSKAVLPDWNRWKKFRWERGSGVVYDMHVKGVHLLVLQTEVADLPTAPPTKPNFPFTQDRTVAAWREGPLLYVMVVAGPQAESTRRYESIVDPRVGPMI